MITVFERIPDLFLRAYDGQFQTWAREYKTRGNRCCVVFDSAPGVPQLLDGEGRKIIRGAWLEAEQQDRYTMVIKPADDFSADLIARHTKEMERWRFS